MIVTFYKKVIIALVQDLFNMPRFASACALLLLFGLTLLELC